MDGLELTGFAPASDVLASLMAEGEDAGLVDTGLDEVVDDELEEHAGGGEEPGAGAGEEQQLEEKIDGRKGSKEFRDALKAWEATPEGAKFAKQARADHFRAQEISTLEPGGVTAMREKYALIESVGGAEGLTTLQERVGAAEAVDAALMSGDPKVFDGMGKEFDAGLAKVTPALLDRVMKSDPEAYAAAILPHLMSGLAGSPLVGDLNKMVDALQAPHLDEAGKVKAVTGLLARIGAWFEHNEKKAGELKTAPVDKGRSDLDQERSKFEQEQQTAHWTGKIQPVVAAYESSKIEELLKPYDTRLKLDAAAKADLMAAVKAKLQAAGKSDAAFVKQMKIYRGQKNPDPAVVSNFVKAAIARHVKGAVDSTVRARYSRFLGGAAKPAVKQVAGARQGAPAAGGGAVTIVSVKPSPGEIDYRKTSEDDQWKGIYTLKSGKKVQVRKQ